MQQKYAIIQNIGVMYIYAHYIERVNKLLKSAIFKGFPEDEIKKIVNSLGAKKEKFNTTETIMSYNRSKDLVGILLSGTADLVTYDYDGNRMILAQYGKDAIFGSIFASCL